MTEQLILFATGFISLVVGAVVGYIARQSIARRRAGTIEQKLQQRVKETEEQSEKIVADAKTKAKSIAETAAAEGEQRRQGFLKTEQVLLQREQTLAQRLSE
jgi:uncharacterized membrane-anchored protein YhcB (DUF1043 family)